MKVFPIGIIPKNTDREKMYVQLIVAENEEEALQLSKKMFAKPDDFDWEVDKGRELEKGLVYEHQMDIEYL